MAILKCKMCGGDLPAAEEGQSVVECEYCGSRQTIPTADNEKKITLFGRAGRLLRACEFDKAAGIFESIVAEFPEESEAYWGLVLCKFGIEYVDDPASGEKVPTCHRSSFESVLEDDNFEQACENADGVARRQYREEAKQIEELRKRIIEVSSNEEPYDIFISYKETDDNGERTLDSVIAQDIYDALTEKGYRVFFSRISLEDKLGVEYEPYIFAALNSAKIMLSVGTDYEHFEAVWVKNEWSRFLALIASGQKKVLIPCFKNIDAYDMPKEFAKLAAQDMGKVGAMQDLLRGVEKILAGNEKTKAEKQEPLIIRAEAPGVESLLKRGNLFLEDKDWKSASEYFDRVLDIDPECSEAYLGKALAAKKFSSLEAVAATADFSIFELKDLEKALRFSGEKLLKEIDNAKISVEKNIHIAEAEAERIRLEKEAEAERIRREEEAEEKRIRIENIKKLAPIRETIKKVQNTFSAGDNHTVGLKSDGTVVTVGSNGSGRCDVEGWTDIAAVSAGVGHTAGLKSDGTVIAAGANDAGQCDVEGWKNIVAVTAGGWHTVGLKSDGTVVAVGENEDGRCNVEDWKDIVAVSTGGGHTVGLKSDGTVVATKFIEGTEFWQKYDGQCDVKGWKNIVAVSAGDRHTVGFCFSGTVVAVGENSHGQCDVEGWNDIVAVSAGNFHTVGLKSDGTVVAAGSNDNGQCNVEGWKNIVAVSAGSSHTLGLKSDGSMVAVGLNGYGQCNVEGWKLFDSFENYEEECKEKRETAELRRQEEARQEELRRQEEERLAELHRQEEERKKAQAAEWRSQGLCQHCGGSFKGLVFKKCTSCGREKDY